MQAYKCRICSSERHSVILDYGPVALAGGLLASLEGAKTEQKYQLTLVFCEDCRHVQIKEIVDPSLLFVNYAWETGVSTTVHKYCEEFAAHVTEKCQTPKDGFVIEMASNDGTLLGEFQKLGRRVLGIDPAKRIAEKATAKGIPTWGTFFNLESAKKALAEHGQANLMVGRNVLAHVADLHGLVGGVKLLLAPGGTAILEFPALIPMFDELQYDKVYHEHIGYHGIDSVRRLAEIHDLKLIDGEMSSLHGGSVRAYLAHKDDPRGLGEGGKAMLAEEEKKGVLETKAWAAFGDRVREQKRLMRKELEEARARGEIVVGYGASGKGQALIQFCELGPEHINYIVDKAPIKHGKFTPGSHIPIHDPSKMKETGANILVLFSWNLTKEIVAQEQEMAKRGMKFLHPIPVPHYVG